jgi:hypothetical protein
MTNGELADVLFRWADIGGRPLPSVPYRVPWGPSARMIEAAERDAQRARLALDELLKTSAKEFPRVGDPLLMDFGMHRWLGEECELAYSDWLAWILEQRSDSRAVLSLFGIEAERLAGTSYTAHREFSVRDGRIDLVIRFNDTAVLAVEIKTTSEPDEEQLERFGDWLSREAQPLGLVLLAKSKPASLGPGGWSFRRWEDIASGLRTWSADWCEEGQLMMAAMTLAFCGAVEQNLLGYGRVGINTPATTRYIESWLEQRKHEKN